MTVTGFAIKPTFVSVVMVERDGTPVPYVLNSTHPTFKRLVRGAQGEAVRQGACADHARRAPRRADPR